MLSSLRRESGSVEEINCAACGRPLLTKESPCPYCKQHAPSAPEVGNEHASEINPRGGLSGSTFRSPNLSPRDEKPARRVKTEGEPVDWGKSLVLAMVMTGGMGVLSALFFLTNFQFPTAFTFLALAELLGAAAYLVSRQKTMLEKHEKFEAAVTQSESDPMIRFFPENGEAYTVSQNGRDGHTVI
jgi:hypothetical protein